MDKSNNNEFNSRNLSNEDDRYYQDYSEIQKQKAYEQKYYSQHNSHNSGCNDDDDSDDCHQNKHQHHEHHCCIGPQGPQGPQGRDGIPGPFGPTGPTAPATQIRGLQVQVQGAQTSVPSGTPVLFDAVISNQSPFLSYSTGTITITDAGVYYINWWVSTNGIEGGTDIALTFSVITSSGANVRASSPIVTGQMSGNALLLIVGSVSTPVTLQLVNVTNGTIFYGTTPIRADLTIFEVRS